MDKLRYERPLIRKLETAMPNKFGTKTDYEPFMFIDGVAVSDLVKKFGSPLFVISENTLRSNITKAKKAFETRYPKVQFAWSYKTNYLNAVCSVFHQEGSWAEVVSGFEYHKALALGMDGKKIIFNGPDKTAEDLETAIKNDSLIHIDHLDEFYTIVDIVNRTGLTPRVAISVNMDTGVYPMWDRFGFNYENGQAWDAINKIIHSKKMELVGLHCHIGTFMLSPNAYGVAAKKLSDLAVSIRTKYNKEISYIDLGGGFASKNTLKGSFLPGYDINPTFDDFAEAISSALLNADFKPDRLPLLILETGRALVDDAGYLISTVISNKRSAAGRRFTIIDAGVNILFTSFWYDHKVTPAQPFTHYTEDTCLYGPLCMNIDVVRESVNLPLLNKGDHIVVHHVGAYNMTQWMQFITLRPNVVMIDREDNVHLIRENEKLETLNTQEKVPGHLTTFA